MEGPANNQESFEDFKKRIDYIFGQEGNSSSLLEEIKSWHSRRQQETDRPGGTIKGRVEFQMQLALIYVLIGKNSSAFDTLSDAWDQANQEGLDELIAEITNMMNALE